MIRDEEHVRELLERGDVAEARRVFLGGLEGKERAVDRLGWIELLHDHGYNEDVVKEALLVLPRLSHLPNAASLAWSIMGEAQAALGRRDEALQSYQRSIEWQPSPEVYVLAAYELPAGNSQAEEFLRSALMLDPKFDEAHYNLGCCLAAQGRTAEAITELREGLRITPDYMEAQRELARCLMSDSSQEDTEAETLLNSVLVSKPEDFWARIYRGIIRYRKQEYEAALEDFEHAAKVDPRSAVAKYHIARTLSRLLRFKDAIAILMETIDITPDYRDAHLLLAAILRGIGDNATADKHSCIAESLVVHR